MALKIGTATCHSLTHEVSILKRLNQHNIAKHNVHFYDFFTHEGPNGSHLCIVTELLGPSLDTIIADYHLGGDRMEPEDIIRVAKQLLQAISALHEAAYAHNGKLAVEHDEYWTYALLCRHKWRKHRLHRI